MYQVYYLKNEIYIQYDILKKSLEKYFVGIIFNAFVDFSSLTISLCLKN